MASTTTTTMTDSVNTVHSKMTSSTSSLSSQSPQPHVARVYKHASQLFLTRRVREALEALEPLLQPPSEDMDQSLSNGTPSRLAPIATASRSARIKVWSLYISILNAIIEIGPDEGENEFGHGNWKELVKRAREGTIWQGVVNVGYNGIEGDVDPDVVANLATLLLAHAPSQRLTQQRLEAYLAASNQPNLDVEAHLLREQRSQSGANGTSTPKDLMSRLKIIEIFTLHVLPRNEEWDYAREFINGSEFLDDDRREAFISTLQSLQDERVLANKKEAELQRQREQQMEDARRREAEAAAARMKEEQRRQKEPVAAPAPAAPSSSRGVAEKHQPVVQEKADGRVSVDGKDSKNTQVRQGHRAKATSTQRGHASSSASSSSAAAKRHKQPPPQTLFAAMQQTIRSFGTNLMKNPMILIRFLAFLVALLMALSRRDIRDRLGRTKDTVWEKLKATVGMGVKVSYV